MLPSGTLTYTLPIPSARIEVGEDAYPGSIGAYSNYVTTAHPRTKNKIEGFKWNERLWTSETDENWATSIPSNFDASTSGIDQSLFQSGIGSGRDLNLESIQAITSSGLAESDVYHPWLPEIMHGYYHDYDNEHYLFSDDSEIGYITYSGVQPTTTVNPSSGFNYINIPHSLKVGVPITVEQYEWDNEVGNYSVALSCKKKVHFTGLRDSDLVRQSTYDENLETILWDKIDNTEPEFIVDYPNSLPRVILNGQYVEEVGSYFNLEFLGYVTGEVGQQYHMKFSPVASDKPVSIYTIMGSGGLYPWTIIPFNQTPVGYEVKVDYDLGIVEFGTTMAFAGSSVYANYWKTLKVEYEPDGTGNTVLASETNLNPIHRQSSRGFVYLSTKVSDPTSITLIAEDLNLIQTDLYGPLYIGNAYTPIVATVKDSNSSVLEGESVDFFITSDPVAGSLGSSSTSTASTNWEGNAKVFYNPPRTIDDIGTYITASGWSVETTPSGVVFDGTHYDEITRLHVEDLLIDGTNSDIFLYAVYIDDPIQGYLDITQPVNDLDLQVFSYYQQYFNTEGIYGATGLTGSGILASEESVAWEDAHRMIWNMSRPIIYGAAGGRGKRVLVSVLDMDALNPHTFQTTVGGVAVPMQPIGVEDLGSGHYNVVFDTSTYSLPKPTASDTPASGTHYGYFLVAPTTVNMQASVFNERLSQTITSNEIGIELRIPSYLSGLWIIDAINDSEIDEISSYLATITASGQHVPLGFRLRSSRVTLAAALDGVTFLDINPLYNYNPYDPYDPITNILPASGYVTSSLRTGHQLIVNEIV